MFKRTIWSLMAVLLLTAFPFVSGCGSDDDGGSGPGPGQTEIPQEIAQEQAAATVEIATGLAQSVVSLAAGDINSLGDFGSGFGGFFFKGAAAEPIETSEYVNGRWIYTFEENETVEDSTFDIDMTATVQYLDATETPQQEPDLTTASMNYTIDVVFGLDTSFTDPETNATSTVSVDAEYDTMMNVTGFQANSLVATGSGSQSVTSMATTPQGNASYSFGLTWDIDLVVPRDGGCPNGTVAVEFGAWDVVVTYNGTSTASWVLSENGVPVNSDTEPLFCGNAAR